MLLPDCAVDDIVKRLINKTIAIAYTAEKLQFKIPFIDFFTVGKVNIRICDFALCKFDLFVHVLL